MEKILNYDNFDSAVGSGVVLVDFWACWCGPCKMLAPSVEELSEEYDGRATVCKVDVDECPELASRFGIMSIPTVLFFKDGELKQKVVGYHMKREYAAILDTLLA